MKMTTSTRAVKLATQNVTLLRKSNDTPIQNTAYHRLMFVLADMFDLIAKGQDFYCIVGATKDKSAFSFTLVAGQDRQSFYADDLADLCLKLEALI